MRAGGKPIAEEQWQKLFVTDSPQMLDQIKIRALPKS
jgi:hypothetical protein